MDRFPRPGHARPEAWLDEAIGLFKVSEEIFRVWHSKVSDYSWEEGKTEIPPDVALHHIYFIKAYLLISGLAMENLLKGALLARDPALIAAPRLQWKGIRQGGHELRDIVRRAGYEPSQAEDDVLEALTEAVVWAGRYPVPLSHAASGGRIYRLAWDRSRKDVPRSYVDLAAFHRHIYQGLFVRVFTNYPIPTEPHRLVATETSSDRP